jgi:hypothetical protein
MSAQLAFCAAQERSMEQQRSIRSAPDLPLGGVEMESAMNALPRTVVAVGGGPDRAEFIDALMLDANDSGVIFVEPVAQGYSRVKQLAPSLVVVLTEIDDPGACQLLSMLSADGATSSIPVVTLVTSRERSAFAEIIAELYADYAADADPGFTAMPMN